MKQRWSYPFYRDLSPAQKTLIARAKHKAAAEVEAVVRAAPAGVLSEGLGGTRPAGIAAYGFTSLTADERDGLADACAEFLRRDHEKPFLLVASFINPHDVCMMAIDAYTQTNNLPARYPQLVRERQCLTEALRLPVGVSREDFVARLCPPLPKNFEPQREEPSTLRTPEGGLSDFRGYVRQNWPEEQWRLHRWAYARLTERVDAEIGEVLDALRTAGLERDTLVVFTSDHGDRDAGHRLEHKSTPFEEAVRVPLSVSLPGVAAAGRVDKTHLVSTGLDLIPTLCDFAGVAAPPALSGRSLKPLAFAPHARQPWRETLVVESQASRILCGPRHKYAVYAQGSPGAMLVDRENDPGEMENLAVDPAHQKTLAEYRRLPGKWYSEHGEKLDEKYIIANDLK